MANVLVERSSLENIADAIREKNGTQTTYKPAEMADAITAISGGGITPSGTKNVNITQNGTTTEDVTNYASAEISVSVPNSYSASDEGKVVSNGALVSQTSDTVTTNDTYDTTLINSLTVNVSGGGGAGMRTATYVVVSGLDTVQKLYNALKTATGFTNLYAVNQSELPVSGACVRSIIWIVGTHGDIENPSASDFQCYRRASNGNWGYATTSGAAITTTVGDEFAVYEIQPYQ